MGVLQVTFGLFPWVFGCLYQGSAGNDYVEVIKDSTTYFFLTKIDLYISTIKYPAYY